MSENKYINFDKRKSDKTNLAELAETFHALQLKYERDTYDLRTQLLEAKADAARYRYIRDNHVWTRHGEEGLDGYALVGCKFPYEANFSCAAMLDYNIDKAINNE